MKKLFIALAVLAALTLSMVPAQANMGIPDDVPGSDAVVPFIVAMGGGLNTVAVFTDVRGWSDASPATSGWNYHYTVNTKESITVYDDNLPGTPYDIESVDAYAIIMQMAVATREMLEVDLDLDGVNDHWVGYIYFDLTRPANGNNQMIGQTLILNIPAGQASAANTWMRERNRRVSTLGPLVDNDFLEMWSANALALAEQRIINQVPERDATAFGLYPRYYINDANSSNNCVIIWKDTNWLAAPPDAAVIPYLHINFFNDEEKVVSSNLPLPYELNIVCLDPRYLPNSLHSGYPKQGWLAIEMPDISGNPNIAILGDISWAGYNWTWATGSAAESWSYLNQIHRDVEWPIAGDVRSPEWDWFSLAP